MLCVLVEQWFHLDLRHLGGNLLVNRLVHELRWVHLLLCNNIAVNLKLLRSPANKNSLASWANSLEKCASAFLHFSGSRKFPRTFLAHSLHIWRSGQVPIVTKLMQFTLQCKTMPQTLIHKIQYQTAPYHYLHRLQEKSVRKKDVLAAADVCNRVGP